MSTNSTIVLKLRKEDIGFILKCDVDKAKVRTIKTFEHDILPDIQKIKNTVEGVELSNSYIVIYHHWDGYPKYLGRWLKEHYKTYEDVLNLMLLGDCSTIIDGVVPYVGMMGGDWSICQPELTNEIPNCVYHFQYYAKPDTNSPDKVIWFWRDDTTWHDENGKFISID